MTSVRLSALRVRVAVPLLGILSLVGGCGGDHFNGRMVRLSEQHHGRTVVGRVVGEDHYDLTIELRPGAKVKIARAEIQSIQDVTSSFESMTSEIDASTTAARCYQAGLAAEDERFGSLARAAFLKAITFDPDHAGARHALGFRREANGRWVVTER